MSAIVSNVNNTAVICIVCAISEEYSALITVLEEFGSKAKYSMLNNSYPYAKCLVPTVPSINNENFTVYVFQTPDQGHADVVVHMIFDQLNPNWIFMCGMCSGNPEKVAYGDVIATEQAFHLDEGALMTAGGEILRSIRACELTRDMKVLVNDFNDKVDRGIIKFTPKASRPSFDPESRRNFILSKLYESGSINILKFKSEYPDIFVGSNSIFQDVLEKLKAESALIYVSGNKWTLTKAGKDFVEDELEELEDDGSKYYFILRKMWESPTRSINIDVLKKAHPILQGLGTKKAFDEILAKLRAASALIEVDGREWKITEVGKAFVKKELGLREVWPEMSAEHPKYLLAPMAVSTFIHEDMPTLWPQLGEFAHRSAGIEMEGLSFYRAVENRHTKNCKVLMVKAVRNMGDGTKDDSFKEYACQLSALWVIEFARRYVVPAKNDDKELAAAAKVIEVHNQNMSTADVLSTANTLSNISHNGLLVINIAGVVNLSDEVIANIKNTFQNTEISEEEKLKNAIEVVIKHKGSRHIKTADLQVILADHLVTLRRFDDAEKQYKLALENAVAHKGEQDKEVGMMYDHYGNFLNARTDKDCKAEGKMCLDKALAARTYNNKPGSIGLMNMKA